MLNKAFKIKLIEVGMRQVDIARLAGISEERLSHLIHGRRKPHPEEKGRLASILKCEVKDIFTSEN